MRLGKLFDLQDVIRTLNEWLSAIPDEFAPRWKKTPLISTRQVVYAGQIVRVDARAADVPVILERPTSRNEGKEILVCVTNGTNQAIVTDQDGNDFGSRDDSVEVQYVARFVSLGDHWELISL